MAANRRICATIWLMHTLHFNNPGLLQQLKQEVHVWMTRPEDVTDPDQLQEYQSLLSSDEKERYRRFHFDRDRHHYLVAHVLLRKALSAYVDVDPSAWQFSQNQHGRPEISGPDIMPLLRFNLTHTNGLVACVVTLELDCGIDVEQSSARGNLLGIADKMFAVSEQQDLMNLDGQAFARTQPITDRFVIERVHDVVAAANEFLAQGRDTVFVEIAWHAYVDSWHAGVG